MSKRTLLYLAAGAFLLPFLAGGVLYFIDPELSPFGEPTYTDEIPATRPKRPDRRLLARHEGKPIAEMIAAAKAERSAAIEEDRTLASPAAVIPEILAMLPDAPLPFPDGSVPSDEAGLKEFVTNTQAGAEAGSLSPVDRWQFNLALAALGVKPEEIPEAIRMPTHPAPENDTDPLRLVARPAELTGPVALGDFDGEDGPEIVAAGGSALFKVGSEGKLIALNGLAEIERGDGLHPADFDADGDLDLFVTRRGGLPDSLLRNDGEGRFRDVTVELGLLAFGDTTAAAWLDYDQDGLLDLLVGSHDRPLELHHQTSAGLFQPVAWDLKLWVPRGIAALAAGDLDGDTHPDLVLVREKGAVRVLLSRPAETWSEWRFADADGNLGFPSGAEISAALLFDGNADQRPDLLLATATPDPSGSLRFLLNEGEGRLAEATDAAGLAGKDPVHSLAAADLDLDGCDDLLLGTGALAPDRVFLNRGGTGFREATVSSQGGYLDETIGWAAGDLEGNGTTDLLAVKRDGRVRWLEATGSSADWIRLALPGQPAGTRVEVSSRDADWVQRTIPFTVGQEPFLTIGLGAGETIERVEIFAAGGTESLKTLEKLEPNRLVVVELPKRPAKRPVVPMTAPAVAGGK
jgi:hypothetical protein